MLVVDVQNDFCSGGALEVPQGDAVVTPINRLLAAFATAGAAIFASRDWHPDGSSHFTEGGGVWPVHCVAETNGAAFHPDLVLPDGTAVVSKGTAPDADGYSAFDGSVDKAGDSLGDALASQGVGHLTVCGLATDYCVRASVLDACRQGLRVAVVSDAIAAVNLNDGDGPKAIEEMRAAGAEFVDTKAAAAAVAGSGPRIGTPSSRSGDLDRRGR